MCSAIFQNTSLLPAAHSYGGWVMLEVRRKREPCLPECTSVRDAQVPSAWWVFIADSDPHGS